VLLIRVEFGAKVAGQVPILFCDPARDRRANSKAGNEANNDGNRLRDAR